jgi:small-conductance mechanosensitive channel
MGSGFGDLMDWLGWNKRRDYYRLYFLIKDFKEKIVADFSRLNEAIETQNASIVDLGADLTAAIERIDADVQALIAAANSDETDQAAIDAAAESLRSSTDAVKAVSTQLQALDPVPPVENPEEPPVEPEQ